MTAFSDLKFFLRSAGSGFSVRFITLIGLAIFVAFAEVFTLGALIPLISILVDNSSHLNSDNVIIRLIVSLKGQRLEPQPMFFTLAFTVAIAITTLCRVSLLKLQSFFGHDIGARLGNQIYSNILNKPYEYHLCSNSSELIAAVTSKIDSVIYGFFNPLVTVISSFIILTFLLSGLIWFVGFEVIYVIFVLCVVYGSVVVSVKKLLRVGGKKIALESEYVVKKASEGLGFIRDIKIDGSQKFYESSFQSSISQLHRHKSVAEFVSGLPRWLVEGAMIIVGSWFVTFLVSKDQSFVSQLPMFAVVVLAAQRSLPVIQQCYGAYARLVSASSMVADLIRLLEPNPLQSRNAGRIKPIIFENEIRILDLEFAYSARKNLKILDQITVTVAKGEHIGIVGTTGSGKSTFLDVLMGLLKPTSGNLEIDGEILTDCNFENWAALIAHVPQTVYLGDLTVRENICLTLPGDAYETAELHRVAKVAQIHEVIESLEEGYETLVGERGIMLSGGQRQRIGIARALWKRSASILILDEATSALDVATETKVIEGIKKLSDRYTIFSVTHRLETLKHCDRVFEIRNSRLIER